MECLNTVECHGCTSNDSFLIYYRHLPGRVFADLDKRNLKYLAKTEHSVLCGYFNYQKHPSSLVTDPLPFCSNILSSLQLDKYR